MRDLIDLGSGFFYSFFQWAPDRELNPQYEGIPDIPKAGIMIWRVMEREPGMRPYDAEEDPDEGHVWTAVAAPWFDTEETRLIPGAKTAWELHSLDPLHIEPSIQMYDRKTGKVPTFHGWIRDGRWVPA